MTAKELTLKVLETTRNSQFLMSPGYRGINTGVFEGDVLNTNGCMYYQWTPHLLEEIKPKQIVELGGAMGVWDLLCLNGKYQDFRLYSITLPEHGLEFSYIKDKYKNFWPCLGNDLDLKNWPDLLNLSNTDLWFFDSEHTPEQLTKEFELYSPFFKKGAVILVDDIRTFGLTPVWEELKSGRWGKLDCYEATDPLHYSGYGVCIYE